ncbi:MAG TPA: hypothetical protein VE907_06390 [Gammaproteobacteria bacterium]|nr:hypothetical protein [Gammaproteobacteria bacterium]
MNRADQFIARTQAALTFVLVFAFIGLLVYGDGVRADKIKDAVSLAVAFWLMRSRPGAPAAVVDVEPNTDVTTTTTASSRTASPATPNQP